MNARVLMIWMWAGWMSVASAFGCSVMIGYIRPTNYEMVREAQTIVLAKAISFKVAREGNGVRHGEFTFKILETIKGHVDREQFTCGGNTASSSWGDPNDFDYHKGDQGPCNAVNYQVGGTYVMLLARSDEGWIVTGPAFSRINVQVAGTDAPWTQAVRRYVEVSKLQNYDLEKQALKQLQRRAANREPGCPRALKTDIDRHFAKPTEAKSFEDLRRLFYSTKSEIDRARVLWAISNGKKREACDFVEQISRTAGWNTYNLGLPACIKALELKRCRGLVARWWFNLPPEFERGMIFDTLRKICGPEDTPLMLRVLQAATAEEADEMSGWFVENPTPLGTEALRKRAGKDYSKGHRGPLSLAALGDRGVLAWALDTIRAAGKDDSPEYGILAISPLPEADAVASEIIRGGDSPALVNLVQGYGEDPMFLERPMTTNPHRWDRLREVMALEPQSGRLRYWLRSTLWELAELGHNPAKELLQKLPPPLADEKSD
jgi:hypothetical protein